MQGQKYIKITLKIVLFCLAYAHKLVQSLLYGFVMLQLFEKYCNLFLNAAVQYFPINFRRL